MEKLVLPLLLSQSVLKIVLINVMVPVLKTHMSVELVATPIELLQPVSVKTDSMMMDQMQLA
jgi:hypothetical protein